MSRKRVRLDQLLRVMKAASQEFRGMTNNFNELSFYWGVVAAVGELARQGFLAENQYKLISRSIVKEVSR